MPDSPIPHGMERMRRLVSLLGLVFWATAASADVHHNKWCQITMSDFEPVSDLRQENARALAQCWAACAWCTPLRVSASAVS